MMTTVRLWALLWRRRLQSLHSFREQHNNSNVTGYNGANGSNRGVSSNSTSGNASAGSNASAMLAIYPAFLAILAFSVAVAILLTVLGGTRAFIYRASPTHDLAGALGPHQGEWIADIPGMTRAQETALAQIAPTYVMLALLATVLLAVPIITLAGSAARLVTARRDAELSALRLAGATGTQTLLLSSLDATAQAFAGAIGGIIGYFLLLPIISLLRFQNQRFTFSQLWVGVPTILLVLVTVVVLSLFSSMITLSKVVVSPLGVRARSTSDHPGRARFVIFVIALIVAVFTIFVVRSQHQDTVSAFIGFTIPLIIIFGLINLVGPAIVRHSARRELRTARTASSLLAARRLLDNPKRAWRNVSGVSLAVFVSGICAAGSLFADGPTGVTGSNAKIRAAEFAQTVLGHDLGLGGTLTLVFAAVLAACSSGIMQAGNLYDQQEEYRELILEGADSRVLSRARLIEVMRPLSAVIVVPVVCVALLLIPAIGTSFLTAPGVILRFVAGIGLCFALMWLGVFGADRAAARLGVKSARPDD